MVIGILSALIVSAGIIYGFFGHRIAEWFRGGETQIPLKDLTLRGKGRHSTTYLADPLRLERLRDNVWRLRTLTGAMVVWQA